MSDLLVKPGQWNSFSSSAVESFLAAMSILLGLTPKRKAFIEQIHQDIHGHYKPDEYYIQSLQNLGRWPLSMQLQYVMKECNDIQKKQFKIWYKELLAMEPMEEINPMLQLMLPSISNTINDF
mgnify:FL=1